MYDCLHKDANSSALKICLKKVKFKDTVNIVSMPTMQCIKMLPM